MLAKDAENKCFVPFSFKNNKLFFETKANEKKNILNSARVFMQQFTFK